jgi:hypothetical protein
MYSIWCDRGRKSALCPDDGELVLLLYVLIAARGLCCSMSGWRRCVFLLYVRMAARWFCCLMSGWRRIGFVAICPDGGSWSCWFLTGWPRIGPVAICSNGHVVSCPDGGRGVAARSSCYLCPEGGELVLLLCVWMAAS